LRALLSDFFQKLHKADGFLCFWDGHAAERVAEVFTRERFDNGGSIHKPNLENVFESAQRLMPEQLAGGVYQPLFLSSTN